jgi:hypothetical protein
VTTSGYKLAGEWPGRCAVSSMLTGGSCKGGGEVTNPLGTSPGSGRRRDGRAMEGGGGDRSGSARAVIRVRRGGMESGGEGGELQRGCAPLL